MSPPVFGCLSSWEVNVYLQGVWSVHNWRRYFNHHVGGVHCSICSVLVARYFSCHRVTAWFDYSLHVPGRLHLAFELKSWVLTLWIPLVPLAIAQVAGYTVTIRCFTLSVHPSSCGTLFGQPVLNISNLKQWLCCMWGETAQVEYSLPIMNTKPHIA